MYFLLLPDRLILQRPPGQFQMLPCPTCQIIQESKWIYTESRNPWQKLCIGGATEGGKVIDK